MTHLPNWNGPNRNEPGRNSDVRGATQRQRRFEAAQDAEGRIEDPRGRTRGRATLESRPIGGFRRSLGGSSTSTPFELRGNLDPPPPAVKHCAPRTHPRPARDPENDTGPPRRAGQHTSQLASVEPNYFSSTVAPAPSRAAFAFSASSFEACSRTV